MVRKYLAPREEGVQYGPQTSQCIKTNGAVALFKLSGKLERVCLALKQISQDFSCSESKHILSRICKEDKTRKDGCPSLLCHSSEVEAFLYSVR